MVLSAAVLAIKETEKERKLQSAQQAILMMNAAEYDDGYERGQ